MARTLTQATTEARWSTQVDLTSASLTFSATSTATGVTTSLAVALDLADPTTVVVQVGALAPGSYLVQLRALRSGKVAFFPSGERDTLTVLA